MLDNSTLYPDQIPVLFALEDSYYKLFPMCDVYDVSRNALLYKGSTAVIAHPPCRLWSRMRNFSTAPRSERLLALWAVQKVRTNGGILEHPAGSALFKKMNIPLDGSPDQTGGFVISINQSWFGFPAEKRTYLYIVGCSRSELPPFPLCFNAIEKTVSSSKKSNLKGLNKSVRSVTTLELCRYLISIQIIIQSRKYGK